MCALPQKTVRCVGGHFICDECHTSGMDGIIAICLNSKSDDPIEILEEMMSMPSCMSSLLSFNVTP